jgi:hypothetical protein
LDKSIGKILGGLGEERDNDLPTEADSNAAYMYVCMSRFIHL